MNYAECYSRANQELQSLRSSTGRRHRNPRVSPFRLRIEEMVASWSMSTFREIENAWPQYRSVVIASD